jgi:hypothetical protein
MTFKTPTKNNFFVSSFAYYFLKVPVHLYHFSKIKHRKDVTKQWKKKYFSFYFDDGRIRIPDQYPEPDPDPYSLLQIRVPIMAISSSTQLTIKSSVLQKRDLAQHIQQKKGGIIHMRADPKLLTII